MKQSERDEHFDVRGAGAERCAPLYEPSQASINVDRSPFATTTFCSWRDSTWRSVLLQLLDNRAVIDEMELSASGDQLLALGVSGRARIESAEGGRWRSANFAPGQVGLTAPDRPTRLRWRSSVVHQTLLVSLPGRSLEDAAEQLWGRSLTAAGLPDTLATTDRVIESTMLAMSAAAMAGTDDLYAESARAFLCVHLLTKHTSLPSSQSLPVDDVRVASAVDFMHDHLASPITLDDLAGAAHLSTFHFLRVFKAVVGEPPRQHLIRLRVDAACRHLAGSELTISEIAYVCGFSSAAHLATAFRRQLRTTPTAYRREHRR